VGLAIEAQGMGYQDVVRMLYGYSFETETILGIRVLESRETPGLGDRIETDPAFLKNFGTLDVSLTSDGTAVAHPIEFVKPGEKTSAWQIDGITGATITSRATATMLRESSIYWIPKVRAKQATFSKPKQAP
jgi:electron transport complex protein RnfG